MRGEYCKLSLLHTDKHFIRIPEKWMQTVVLKKNDVSLHFPVEYWFFFLTNIELEGVKVLLALMLYRKTTQLGTLDLNLTSL